jgi:hypothetical protein
MEIKFPFSIGESRETNAEVSGRIQLDVTLGIRGLPHKLAVVTCFCFE